MRNLSHWMTTPQLPTLLLPALLLLMLSAAPLHAQIPTPSEHLGRPLGGDFTLADWDEVSSYYHKLAAGSDRVLTQTLGQTTEGRDFLISVFSSPQNLANLDAIREYSRIIADPRHTTKAQRDEAIARGKVILVITNAMHATEVGAPQFGMAFAHQLATSNEEPFVSARENMVVVMTPTLNPDGLDRVVHWYRENVNTPHEGASLTELYQHYAGHDNNRDWFMISLEETKMMSRQLYHRWNPQMLWDVHQQGNGAERLFVPPYRDPLNPNLDPVIMSQINSLGMKAVQDMTAAGITGVATGITYDQWWVGGNRNVPVRHNIIGVLSEAASANLASPIFQKRSSLSGVLKGADYGPSNQYVSPWPGGWWRIGDIINYELALGRSFLHTLSRDRAVYLRNKMGAATRVIQRGQTSSPRGWVIPADNPDIGATRRLVDALMRGGVEIHTARSAVVADEITYPKGSIVIHPDQPNAAYVKDLFETQKYPEGAAPYDVSGWTLPALMGVRRVIAVASLEAKTEMVDNPHAAVAKFTGAPTTPGTTPGKISGALSARDSDTWTKIIAQLKANKPTWFITDGPARGHFTHKDPNRGGFLGSSSSKDEIAARKIEKLPRLAIYHPWSGSMDGGWLRWTLDHFGLPFDRIHNEQIRAGELNAQYDVIIMPSITASSITRGRSLGSVDPQFTGGLGIEGAGAIEAFVRNGGRLVTLGSSSAWAIQNLGLPLVDTTREKTARDAKFSCPGSVLNANLADADHPLTAGLADTQALFFSNSSAYRAMTDDERKENNVSDPAPKTQALLRYAPRRVLLSGYLKGEEIIANRDAWVRVPIGDGAAHLFGFRPHYRSWTQGTFHLLLRAVLLD